MNQMNQKGIHVVYWMLVIGLLTFFNARTLFAQPGQKPGSPPGDFIERLDKDGDGLVSQEEFDGPKEHFANFDKDGDGYIDQDEKPSGNMVQDFDRDGDGKLSMDEFPGLDDHFTRLDQNGDGYIEQSEAPKRLHGSRPGGRRSRMDQ